MDATTQTLIHDARVYDRAFDLHKPPVRDVIVKADRIVSVSLPDELVEEKRAIKQAAAQGQSGARVVEDQSTHWGYPTCVSGASGRKIV